MKSKIILILIFLLAVCLISPIAAEDNSTAEVDDIHVSFNSTVYEKDLGSIDVEVPQNKSGNLRAEINDVEFYNENITGSVKVPISIPKNAQYLIFQNRNTDHTNYRLNLFFNNTLLNSSHTLKVMMVSPNYTVQAFPSEILKGDNEGYIALFFPESANGDVDIYINGVLAQSLKASQFTFLDITKFNSLALGNHRVTIVYSGDEYYRKFNKTFNFTVVDMLINIPKNVVLEHDDCISGKLIKNKDGIVTIKVDGRKVFSDKLDQYGEFLHSLFSDVTCGEHTVEVSYSSSKFNYSKTQKVNVSYYVEMFNFGMFIYGEDSQVTIIVPTDFNKNLINITIDSIPITGFTIDNSGWIEIDVSRYAPGNHSVAFDFKGDEKYYSYSINGGFTMEYGIVVPSEAYVDGGGYASLTLPATASGDLELYINDKLYKKARLANGHAIIAIDNLIPGDYRYLANYTGDDFNVSQSSGILRVYPDITTPGDMYCGEDRYIVVMAPNAKGKVIFNVNGRNITALIKDGKAILSLKNFRTGDYDIEAHYFGGNGFNTTVYVSVFVMHSSIRFYNLKVTSENAKMKVYINGRLAKNTYVLFKIDKITKKIKTDRFGIATISLAPGKHTITAYFGYAMVSKTVNVHVVNLKSVVVKKSAKKLVLMASLKKGKIPLKNKIVVFKFNGKTYKAKTNRYGVAKVTVKGSVLKKLKVGKNVIYQATYLKDTVRKSAKVLR